MHNASSSFKDVCPQGDYSLSYYDGKCIPDEWIPSLKQQKNAETKIEPDHNNVEIPASDSIKKDINAEYLTAYEWAYKY